MSMTMYDPAVKFAHQKGKYPGAYGSSANVIARLEGLYQDLAEVKDTDGNIKVNLDTLFVDMLEAMGQVDKWLEMRAGSATYLPNLYTSVAMITGIAAKE